MAGKAAYARSESKTQNSLTINRKTSTLLYMGGVTEMMNAEFFDLHVQSRLQKALSKLVLENYKESSRFCFRYFATPQAKDLSGVFRRAKIEENLAGICDLFPEVTVKNKPYENNTGFYNEITIGKVKLTQSCIANPSDPPRFAQFRATLAKTYQLPLFQSEEPQEPDPQYMYAILTHGVDFRAPKRGWPAFIRVQFPNEQFTQYVDEGINLLNRFPDLVAEYIPKPTILRQPIRRRRKEFAEA